MNINEKQALKKELESLKQQATERGLLFEKESKGSTHGSAHGSHRIYREGAVFGVQEIIDLIEKKIADL